MASLTTPTAAEQHPVVIEGLGLRKTYGTVTALDGVDVQVRGGEICAIVGDNVGTVTALDGVDVQVRGGEICAIVGDNGAGKSTLIKILAGALLPDAGETRVLGRPV